MDEEIQNIFETWNINCSGIDSAMKMENMIVPPRLTRTTSKEF